MARGILLSRTLAKSSGRAHIRRLGDETVILHLSRGIYFGLDAMGTIVWERLQEGDTPEAILAYIRANLSNVPGTVEAEVTHFLMQLLENELIAPR